MQELFHVLLRLLLLHRVDHCLESLRVVQGEVSQHLTVETHVLLCESADELRVVHTVLTGSGIDTLNPKRTEVGPDILPGEEVTAGLFENFLTACS